MSKRSFERELEIVLKQAECEVNNAICRMTGSNDWESMSYAVTDYFAECYLENSECPRLFELYPELVRAWSECVFEDEGIEHATKNQAYTYADGMSDGEMDLADFEFFKANYPECDFSWDEYWEYLDLKNAQSFHVGMYHGAYCEEVRDKQEAENKRLNELKARLGVFVGVGEWSGVGLVALEA